MNEKIEIASAPTYKTKVEEQAQMTEDYKASDHSFSMMFHFRADTPMKVVKSGPTTYLKIGSHPSELTIFITPKFAEDLIFILREYQIVEGTRSEY
jgi:hypothetical protein